MLARWRMSMVRHRWAPRLQTMAIPSYPRFDHGTSTAAKSALLVLPRQRRLADQASGLGPHTQISALSSRMCWLRR